MCTVRFRKIIAKIMPLAHAGGEKPLKNYKLT